MQPYTHVLKCDSEYFRSLWDGTKTFEYRYNDRAYQKGDRLHLLETEGIYKTGRTICVDVTYVFPVPNSQGAGHVVLGLDMDTLTKNGQPDKPF